MMWSRSKVNTLAVFHRRHALAHYSTEDSTRAYDHPTGYECPWQRVSGRCSAPTRNQHHPHHLVLLHHMHTRSRHESMKADADEDTKKPTPIDSRLSLELRLRWLEVLLLGVKHDSWDRDAHASSDATPRQTRPDGESLVKRAEEVQKKLDKVVDANDGLKKFIDRCE